MWKQGIFLNSILSLGWIVYHLIFSVIRQNLDIPNYMYIPRDPNTSKLTRVFFRTLGP